VTDTMTNEVTAIESELHKILVAMGQPQNYIKFDLRGLQRGDFKSQMAGFKDGVYSGTLKRSEIREWMDLPFEDGSDELLQPAAYYTIDPQTGDLKPLPSSTSGSIDPLAPVALAHEAMGRTFDIDSEVKESVNAS
jgi:hypothetical protein